MVVLSTPSVSPGDSIVRKTFRQAGECYSRTAHHVYSRARGSTMRKSMTGMSLAVLLLANTGVVGAQDVYVYPAKNQSDEQMARDKEECHDWAVKQTSVDPEKLATESVTPPPSGGASSGAGSGLGGAGLGAARGARWRSSIRPVHRIIRSERRSSRTTTAPSAPASLVAATPCSSRDRLTRITHEHAEREAGRGPSPGAGALRLRHPLAWIAASRRRTGRGGPTPPERPPSPAPPAPTTRAALVNNAS